MEMSVEDGLRAQGVKVHGTFDPQAALDYLAKVFSKKYGVIITFKIPEKSEDEVSRQMQE